MDQVILGRDAQTHVTLTAETIQHFIRFKKSEALLVALEPLSSESKTHILASNNVVLFLATNGHTTAVFPMLEALNVDQQFEILNSGNAFEGLLRQGQVGALLPLIKKLQPEHQTVLLSKPYVMARYFALSEDLALQAVEIIAHLSPEQQTNIFSTHEVVSSLSKKGLAMDVFALIAKLSLNQKARIAIAKGYQDVSSYCSRRKADRQTPLHLAFLASPDAASVGMTGK